MTMKHHPITTPPNWDAAQDFKFYAERFGESNDYFSDVLGHVEYGYRFLDDRLDVALKFFGYQVPVTASMLDKIETLEQHCRGLGRAEKYVERLAETANYCRFACWEYQRIMGSRHQEATWLMPLADLSDLLVDAGMQFEDFMFGEHRGYKMVKVG